MKHMSSHPLTLTPGPPLTPSSKEYVQCRIQSNPPACEWNTCPLIPSPSHLAPLSAPPFWDYILFTVEHNLFCRQVNEPHFIPISHLNLGEGGGSNFVRLERKPGTLWLSPKTFFTLFCQSSSHYRFILYFHTNDVYIRHSTYTVRLLAPVVDGLYVGLLCFVFEATRAPE